MCMNKKIRAMRLLSRLFYVFPVMSNRVVLTSYNGRLYTCSPKYIAEALAQRGDYEVLYALRNGSTDQVKEGMRRISYKSLAHFYYLMTARFVVLNSSGFSLYLPYRESQVVIQTWHGGYSFKVIGNEIFTDKESIERRKLAGKTLTYFLSSSRAATVQHAKAMSVPVDKFLEIGLPRNDVLFRGHTEIRHMVCNLYGIDEASRIVLYAPTYRDTAVGQSIDDSGIPPINDATVVEALSQRFGSKYVFMYKAHHDMLPANMSPTAINASGHSDIQELMCAADVIISDYSSCIADFALQRKAGFLYTPDLDEYARTHPLSMDPGDWPYQTANSNEELVSNILGYDEECGAERIENFFDRIGCCEDGHATESLISVMNEAMGH